MSCESSLSILVVDDEPLLGKSLVRDFALLGHRAIHASSAAVARNLLDDRTFDVLLTDLYLPGETGLTILQDSIASKRVRAAYLMSANATVEMTVCAMRHGAVSVLEKPFDLATLNQSFGELFAPPAGPVELSTVPELDVEAWRARFAPSIIGNHPALLHLFRTMMRVCDVESNVLILGESGTGKELVANALHAAGSRRNGPFVPLNCAAIPDTLVESELFGYTKGAFTGATSARLGRFAVANKGSIFLDEIAEMDLQTQAKVLRVIQSHEYTPVGETQARKCDVRIIAATHRDLRERVEEGAFREDLMFRLGVIVLRLPPLRNRKSDLPLLVQSFIARVNKQTGRRVAGITDDALAMLGEHDWPGNIRELENTIERLVVMRPEGRLSVDDLRDMEFTPRKQDAHAATPASTEASFPDGGVDLKAELERLEATIIQRALVSTGGNQKRAAELLHVNRTTLIEKLRRMQRRPSIP